MKIGNWELRNPLVHYVNIPIEQEMYEELRAHFGEKIAQEIEALKCDFELPEEDCLVENSALQQAADIARGKK